MAITLDALVYTYTGNVNGIAQFLNAGATPAASNVLTAKVDGAGSTGSAKARWKLKMPVASTDPAVAARGGVDHESFVDIVVTMAPQATAAERTNLLDSIKDLVATTQFGATISSLVPPSA